jgi:ribosomal protein S18 acetylase RimI-like enzyme
MLPTSEVTAPAHDVVFADAQDADRIFDILTLAFAADPPNRWMYPDAEHYLRHFPDFAMALGGAALSNWTALVNTDYTGVALWLPPEVGPDDEALANLIADSVAAAKKSHLMAIVEEMGRYHPTEPHWYLPFIGVDPAQQGKGLGGALLKNVLLKCDETHFTAYLESTNPKNRSLYERHGFRAIGEIKIGDCPPIVPMLRHPLRPIQPENR